MWNHLIVSLILAPFVLSVPDLCRNPKLDSITYIDPMGTWFFTSGGYFWYIKEKDFPPRSPKGKLPSGFSRGDAVFFSDYIKVCDKSNQLVVMVEKSDSGNKIIEYDIRNPSWTNGHNWEDDHILAKSNIEDPKAQIDAIFSLRNSEVYVVQKEKLAAVQWKPLCSDPNGFGKPFPSQSSDSLQNSRNDPIDAIAVKGDSLYYFIGSEFWMSTIDTFRSKDGKIVITKGNKRNVSKDFFKFKKCPPKPTEGPESQNTGVPSNTIQGNGGGSGGEGESDHKPDSEPQTNEDANDGLGDNNSGAEQGSGSNENKPDSDSGNGGNGLFLVVLIVVILVVVTLVIAIVVFAMSGKSSSDQELGATKAQNSKVSAKPKVSKVSKVKK